MSDELSVPVQILTIGLAALWLIAMYCWLGPKAALAVALTLLVIAVAVAGVELVLGLIDRAAGRGEGL